MNACGGKGDDLDRDGYVLGEDCDDRDSRVHPGAEEICDGADNDCDGNTDGAWAADATLWYIDYDGDGWGAEAYTELACERPEGFVDTGGDCDDANDAIHPEADELCDFEDGDCDGAVDDDAVDAQSWYLDGDHDGHGLLEVTIESCVQPPGYTARPTDCDDADADVHVGALERCDGVDEDCDGEVDEGAEDALTWYLDADGDGYGDPETVFVACEGGEGAVEDGTDCDDAYASISPAEAEICENHLDDDCDRTDNGCAPSGAWTLDVADAVLLGSSSYDSAGSAVAYAGDVDGDGDTDLIVGIPGSDAREDASGLVAVIAGPLSEDTELDNAMAQLQGMQEGDRAGDALAGIGDVDGDGYADVLVGAPSADTSEEGAGTTYLVLGPLTDSLALSLADAKIKGRSEEKAAGTSLCALGDLDDDGVTELAIGAPGGDEEGDGAGAAWVIPADTRGVEDLEELGTALLGYGDDAQAGRSVSGTGDVDGDGVGDVIVGAPGDEAGGTWAGAAYLVHGPVSDSLLLTHEGVALRGEEAGDAAGWSVAGLGDMNGDGYADLAVGAQGADGDATDSGVAYVIEGPVSAMSTLAEATARLRGRETRGFAGWSVAGVGDVNADGATDLAVGARGSDGAATDGGAVHLLYGPIEASTGLDAAEAVYYGPGAGDLAGTALAGGGDAEGDGYMDVLVGGPAADGESASSGAVWLLLGSGL